MSRKPEGAPLRVLVDLKPALDGYAGIPQESRLLFRELVRLENLEVEGLIQHGGRRLRPGLKPDASRLSVDKRVDLLSKVVVSLYENPYSNLWEQALQGLDKLFARQALRLRSHLGLTLPMTQFDSTLFEDFVWRTFFSKTLSPADREVLRGARYRILEHPRVMMHKAGLAGLRYSDTPSYPRIRTKGIDAFITQTPFPGRVQQGTQLIVRYHDAVPILMPHTVSDKAFHQASHFHALKDNVNNGAWFSCISNATREDLLKVFPQAEKRSFVIHNIVSDEYYVAEPTPERVFDIIRNRVSSSDELPVTIPREFRSPLPGAALQYLLMVSTLEPRKNHQLLLQAWEQLRYTQYPELKLVLVGNPGWDQGPILNSMKPWSKRGDLFWLNNVPAAELRVLYQHAAVTVCPGFAEGFDYAGVEAMKCECPILSSDIPVHREIYGAASEYFSAYSVSDAVNALQKLLSSEWAEARKQRVGYGTQISRNYSSAEIQPKWIDFLSRKNPKRSK